jgi:hypothetical protein
MINCKLSQLCRPLYGTLICCLFDEGFDIISFRHVMGQTIIIRDINQALEDKSEHSRKFVLVTFTAIATAGIGVSEEGTC